MSDLLHFDVSDDKEKVYAAIQKDGACVVDNFISEEFCDELITDFGRSLERMDWGNSEQGDTGDLYSEDGFYGYQTKRLHGLFSKSDAMVNVLLNPYLLNLADRFLLRDKRAREIRLSNAELMVLNGGQTNQSFHTDAASWYRVQQEERRNHPGTEVLVSANIALTEFTSENGATRVVTGSHLWDANREPQNDEVCLATMPKGSTLLYSGNVIHSGGENRTRAMRVGLYLGYIVSWLRPIENQMVTNRPEDIFALPLEAQRLLDVVPGGFSGLA
jgi:ectoine hydroxylase-related dioxygenase (phytanoyl-CoA dioxygenase family)